MTPDPEVTAPPRKHTGAPAREQGHVKSPLPPPTHPGTGQPCSLSFSLIDRPHRPASGTVWLRSAIFVVLQSPSPRENCGAVGAEGGIRGLTAAPSGRRRTMVARATGGRRASGRRAAGGGGRGQRERASKAPPRGVSALPAGCLRAGTGFSLLTRNLVTASWQLSMLSGLWHSWARSARMALSGRPWRSWC